MTNLYRIRWITPLGTLLKTYVGANTEDEAVRKLYASRDVLDVVAVERKGKVWRNCA